MKHLIITDTNHPRGLSGEPRMLLAALLRQHGLDPAHVTHIGIPATALGDMPDESIKKLGIKAVQGFREEVLTNIAAHKPDKILTLGGTSLSIILGRHIPITKYHGLMERLPLPGGRTAMLMGTLHPSMCLRIVPPNEAGHSPRDWVRSLSGDVRKWIAQDKPQALPNDDYVEPQTFDEMIAALALLDGYELLSCDVETEPSAPSLAALREAKSATVWREAWPKSGLDPMVDRMMSFGLGTVAGPLVIINRHMLALPETPDLLWDYLWTNNPPQLAFHNAKFDLQFIASYTQAHAPEDANIVDTQLMSFLLDERPVRSEYKAHGLKDISRMRYDVPDYHFDFPAFWKLPDEERDWDLMHRYHAMDLRITARLYWDLAAEMDEEPGLWNALETLLLPGSLALAEAELRGVPVDREYLQDRLGWYDHRLDRRLRMLRSALNDPDFNPASAAQVKEVLFEDFGWEPIAFAGYKVAVTTTAVQNARKEQVEKLAGIYGGREARIARSIVAWKHDYKARQTYVASLLRNSEYDGRVRASFNLAGAATGRLSSSDPNMQNIPKRGPTATAIRRAFKATDGWMLMEADYSQLEIRVAALLSRDEKLAQVYRENRDIHREVAAVMFNKPAADLSYMERYLAKAVDFGALYGRSGKAISLGAEMDYYETVMGGTKWTPEEAQAFVDKFLNGFPDLKRWLGQSAADGIANQELTTLFGRKRRFPLILAKDRGQISRQSFNTPIQSVASDICLGAFSRLAMRLDPDEAKVLFPIHDAVLLEVRKDKLAEVATVVRYEMEENLPPEIVAANVGLDILWTVDVKAGIRWADDEMHEVEEA